MITRNWFGRNCKNEWAIFTHYISFTGPFVWSCQSHTFTHCWDRMSNGTTFVSTHCWANNVCQFDLSLTHPNGNRTLGTFQYLQGKGAGVSAYGQALFSFFFNRVLRFFTHSYTGQTLFWLWDFSLKVIQGRHFFGWNIHTIEDNHFFTKISISSK